MFFHERSCARTKGNHLESDRRVVSQVRRGQPLSIGEQLETALPVPQVLQDTSRMCTLFLSSRMATKLGSV